MLTYGIEKLGIIDPKAVYRNLTPAELTEAALRRGEGKLNDTGALVVTTGKYTGRSPEDKFIVDTPAVHDWLPAYTGAAAAGVRHSLNSASGPLRWTYCR